MGRPRIRGRALIEARARIQSQIEIAKKEFEQAVEAVDRAVEDASKAGLLRDQLEIKLIALQEVASVLDGGSEFDTVPAAE